MKISKRPILTHMDILFEQGANGVFILDRLYLICEMGDIPFSL